MATLLEVFALRSLEAMQQRVTAQCWKTAEVIRQEDESTPHHAGRLAWANAVTLDGSGNGSDVQRMLAVVIGNTTIQDAGEAATDQDIEYVVVNAVDDIVA